MRDLGDDILKVHDLKKYFYSREGWLRKGVVKAVDGVSFSVREGETFGLIGESGSGKTTVGKMLVGIYSPTEGRIWFKGREVSDSRVTRTKWFKREVQIVFQNPISALNPRRSVRQILQVPLQVHHIVERNQYKAKIAELLEIVKLPPEYMSKYPHALSGGEKQRVSLARALALNPSFVILDEPTSALDVSVQAKIIALLLELKKDWGLTYLFISHDLSLVRNVAERTAVMYAGRLCEIARTEELFNAPLHPYTQMLLAAIPVVSEEEEKIKPHKIEIEGEILSHKTPLTGCSFYPRCKNARSICSEKKPEMVEISVGHLVSCHMCKENGGDLDEA